MATHYLGVSKCSLIEVNQKGVYLFPYSIGLRTFLLSPVSMYEQSLDYLLSYG